MRGNSQVRFLGEGVAAMPLPYPTCAVEERRRTVPKEQPKKDFTPFRAGSAAPDDSGGSWDKGRESPTAGHSRICQAF